MKIKRPGKKRENGKGWVGEIETGEEKPKRLKGGLVLERETKGWSFKSSGEGAVPVRVPEAGKNKKKTERGV